MPQMTVNLIGAGRVGQTLLRLLGKVPECAIQDVLSNSIQSARIAVEFAGRGRAVERYSDLRPADLWILSVPDTQISAVAERLAGAQMSSASGQQVPIAIHCSGFFAAEQMAPVRQLGWLLASVHPVLTFATPELAVTQFKGTYCGVEGDADALEALGPLLEKIGGKPFPIASRSKSLYHAAAVISNNFTVVLQAIAREAWAEAGVPDYVTEQLNNSMLRATYENVASEGPQTALTGPAARGDEFVVSKQGEDVARWHPEAGAIYRELSVLAKRLKSEGTTLDTGNSEK